MDRTIHIAFATNDNYAVQTCTAIHSILKFATRPCIFYILHHGLGEVEQNDLRRITEDVAGLKFIDIKDFGNWMNNNTIWPDENFYRYLLPSLLPKLHKVIYLDCDTLIKGDIVELWDKDITKHTLAAVEDCMSKYNSKRIGKKPYPYFNAGVLLMNLDEWRRNDITHKVFGELFKYRDANLKCPDQDVLNMLLYGTVQLLPTRFNAQNIYFWQDSDEYNFAHPLDLSDSLIIHFTGPQKPWTGDYPYPYHMAWHINKGEAYDIIFS